MNFPRVSPVGLRPRGFTLAPILLTALAVLTISAGAYFVLHKETVGEVMSVYLQPAATSTTLTGLVAKSYTSHFGCYARTANNVYKDLTQNEETFVLSPQAQIVVGADPATFKELVPYGHCFGKDANRVYRNIDVLPWADPATFELLWYSKPGPVLFFRNGTTLVRYDVPADTHSEIPRGDPATLEEMLGAYDFAPWAKDKNNIYCNGDILPGADPRTARLDGDGQYLLVTVNGSPRSYGSECTVIQ